MKHVLTSTWPAVLFLSFIAVVYLLYAKLWGTFLILRLRGKYSSRTLISPFAIFLHIIAFIGILCFGYGYFIEPYWLDVQHVEIQTDKLMNTSFRVVQFSDTHCDIKKRLESRLPEVINDLHPDIVVFTGDALNTPDSLDSFKSMLIKIQAPLGKYGVKGNWDVRYWPDQDLFGNTGFEELALDSVTVEKNAESIVISGLNYNNGKISWRVVGHLREDNFNLFLFHTTGLLNYFDEIPIDLYLSGHTHGGQVALPLYGALTTLSPHGKQYESGLYKHGDILLYINRGLGMEGGHMPRVRFLARPEVTVFDIVPASSGIQEAK